MKKLIFILLIGFSIFCLIAATQFTSQKPKKLNQQTNQSTLSIADIKSLENRGFTFAGQYTPVRSPRMLDSTNLPETTHIKISLDIRKAKNLQITWLGTPNTKKVTNDLNDIILTEGFEGDFPGSTWRRTGDPTWGKSTYQKHSGQNSVYCAKDETAGVIPPTNYPNNMDAMMIFGPFDLSNASMSFLRFWYWLETEKDKDWFSFMASKDGINYGGISVSSSTGANSPSWEQTSLNLANVPKLGSLIGQSSVWIAFGFTSDSTGTKRGVFVDDVEVHKAVIGTGISGYLKGSLSPAGNPYIAFDHVGVAQGDSLSILPGCELRFDAAKEFVVQGLLNARGEEGDSIRFISNKTSPNSGDWIGLGFYNSVMKGSSLKYCNIKYAGYGSGFHSGIYVASQNVKIEKCFISMNSGPGIFYLSFSEINDCILSRNNSGIATYMASPTIKNNIIEDNKERGISLYLGRPFIKGNIIRNNFDTGISAGEGKPLVFDNIIEKNKIGISAGGSDGIGVTGELIIAGNQILDNRSNGIHFSAIAPSATLTGNIIKGNQNGFYYDDAFNSSAEMIIYNNTIATNIENGLNFSVGDLCHSSIVNNIIVFNSKAGVKNTGSNTSVQIEFNNVYGNNIDFSVANQNLLGVYSHINANGDSVDIYNNLKYDPLFVNANQNDYQLQSIKNGYPVDSPCIDDGNPCAIYNDYDGSINDIGYTGGSRLFISLTKSDFGQSVLKVQKSIDFHIYNHRDSALSVSEIKLSDSQNFSISPTSTFQIAPYNSYSMTATFKPIEVGKVTSNFNFTSNDFLGSDTASIKFSGEGITGTIISNNTVSGIWTKANSPYIINVDDLTIPTGDSLKIEPGVDVIFKGNKKNGTIIVYGILRAIGTSNENITFKPFLNAWDGIHFINSDGDNYLQHCKIERVVSSYYSGIYSKNSHISISDCSILNCYGYKTGAIYIEDSEAIILRSLVKNNNCAISGISSSLSIVNCVIEGNSNGIFLSNCYATVRNNIIKNNSGAGISMEEYGQVTCTNNIIYGNTGSYGYGIYLMTNSKAVIENNTVFNNKQQGLYFKDVNFAIVKNIILFNNGFGGYYPGDIKGFGGNVSVTYSDIGWPKTPGEGNIDSDPLFIDPSNVDFRLLSNSPCIDAGDPDSIYSDPEDPNNLGSALWPAQGTIRNDMGAYGGPYAAGSSINFKPNAFNLLLPADGDTLNTQTPGFKWRRSIDPNPGDKVRYTLQLDFKQDFSNPVSFSNIADTTYQIQMKLYADLTYYWRVIAADSAGLQRTSKEVFRFTIGNVGPLAFNLFHPENNDTVFTLTPQLDWKPAEDPNFGDAIRYTLFFAQDSGFAKADTMKDISSNSFLLDRLADHQNYFWKVKVEDNHGASTFSHQIFQFFTFAAPLPFKLEMPVTDDTISSDTVHFRWQKAFDPNPADTIRYTLFYDLNRLFLNPVKVSNISDTTFFLIDSLKNNTRYHWTILAVDKDSFTSASKDTFSFLIHYRPTGIAGAKDSKIPNEFALNQNYPNPFNPRTTIKYELPAEQEVKLTIYNLRGQCIATLLNRKEPAGYYTVIWNGLDEQGQPAASGVYFYRLTAGKFEEMRKMVLMR